MSEVRVGLLRFDTDRADGLRHVERQHQGLLPVGGGDPAGAAGAVRGVEEVIDGMVRRLGGHEDRGQRGDVLDVGRARPAGGEIREDVLAKHRPSLLRGSGRGFDHARRRTIPASGIAIQSGRLLSS